ncbi:hypothetical protein GCM10027514_05180 [Azotobacter armeniacus]
MKYLITTEAALGTMAFSSLSPAPLPNMGERRNPRMPLSWPPQKGESEYSENALAIVSIRFTEPPASHLNGV